MSEDAAHTLILEALQENGGQLPDLPRQHLAELLSHLRAARTPDDRHRAFVAFHRFLWQEEDTLSLIPPDAIVGSRKIAFPTFIDAAIEVISTVLIRSPTLYPTFLWRDHLWFPTHALWKLYYYLQIRDSGLIVGIETDPERTSVEGSSQATAIQAILRVLGDGTPPVMGWANHPGRLVAFPMVGIPRRSKRAVQLVDQVRQRDLGIAHGWACIEYPRIETTMPVVLSTPHLYPGGPLRGQGHGLASAYRAAAFHAGNDWRLPFLKSVMSAFLLRQDRRHGHIAATMDASSLSLPVLATRVANHWYFPLASVVILCSHLGALPILSKRILGDRYWTADDFWLCGGSTILTSEQIFDVQIGLQGRFPCVRLTADMLLPDESEEVLPDGKDSQVIGKMTYMPSQTRPKFLLITVG